MISGVFLMEKTFRARNKRVCFSAFLPFKFRETSQHFPGTSQRFLETSQHFPKTSQHSRNFTTFFQKLATFSQNLTTLSQNFATFPQNFAIYNLILVFQKTFRARNNHECLNKRDCLSACHLSKKHPCQTGFLVVY